jgi:hypothetical protein
LNKCFLISLRKEPIPLQNLQPDPRFKTSPFQRFSFA